MVGTETWPLWVINSNNRYLFWLS